uniref:Ribosomal RNA small subunit methyltransferase I n=1 Tax=candidate division WOR-3 bacterium TaxID=2052148 RepID=A0A7C6ECP1_UNCW3
MVSTPIGNLEDITLRALSVLREVDLIACEDTRRTGLLLAHYQIKNRLISYHEHNKFQRTPFILELLRQGKRVALVSDAGTPGISDPGFYLIRAAIEKNFRVIPVPGASAILAGIVISGLPSDRFAFEGFLPKREGRKQRKLADLRYEPRTMIFYDSPTRVKKTLERMLEIFQDRRIVLVRELTKKFEETIRGRISEVIEAIKNRELKGEIVLIVEGYERGV